MARALLQRRSWTYHQSLALGLFVVIALLGFFMRAHRADDAYITYRYAKNLAHGNGFVFNVGERVLGTTAPLHGLVLSPFALITDDLPTVANILSYATLLVLALAMFCIFNEFGISKEGAIAAAGIALTVQSYLFAPLETILAAALCWLVILFFITDRGLGVCVCGALACLVRPDSALLVALVLFWQLIERRSIFQAVKSGLLTLLFVSPWLLWAWFYYGSPFPATALAKSGWQGHVSTFLSGAWDKVLKDLLFGSPLISGLVILLALVGTVRIFSNRAFRRLIVIPLWLFMYGVAYTLLRIPYSFSWYYYPFVCGAFFLAALGVMTLFTASGKLIQRFRTTGRVLLVAPFLVALTLVVVQFIYVFRVAQALPQQKWSGARDELYCRVGRWFSVNAPKGASVAMCEVGAIAYHSDIHVIDLWGLVTPAVIAHIKGGDYEWAVDHFKPLFVISHYRGKSSQPGPTQWLNRTFKDYVLVESFQNDDYPFILDVYRLKTLPKS